MENFAILAIVCLVFALALLVVVFLQFKLNESLVKDVLGLRIDLKAIEKQVNLSLGSNNRLQNKAIKEFEKLLKSMEHIGENAAEANAATQTILNEYELNGTPLGYIRNEGKEPQIDAYEGF